MMTSRWLLKVTWCVLGYGYGV